MKYRTMKPLILLVVALSSPAAFADKVILYTGDRGYHERYQMHHSRHADRHDYRSLRHERRAHSGHRLHRPYRFLNEYGFWEYSYRNDKPRYADQRRPSHHHHHHHGDVSRTPVLTRSRIGGALLGASAGRDMAHRHTARR